MTEENKPVSNEISAPSKEGRKIIVHSLPDGALKLIDEIVEKQVAEVEKRYKWVGIIMFTAGAIVLSFIYNASISAVKDAVSKELATNEVKEQSQQIQAWHKKVMEAKERIRSIESYYLSQEQVFKSRLEELQKNDRIVTYDRHGRFVIAPKDGVISVRKDNGFFTHDIESGRFVRYDHDPLD